MKPLTDYNCIYCMSKRSCPFLYSDSLYDNGQDCLDIQYEGFVCLQIRRSTHFPSFLLPVFLFHVLSVSLWLFPFFLVSLFIMYSISFLLTVSQRCLWTICHCFLLISKEKIPIHGAITIKISFLLNEYNVLLLNLRQQIIYHYCTRREVENYDKYAVLCICISKTHVATVDLQKLAIHI